MVPFFSLAAFMSVMCYSLCAEDGMASGPPKVPRRAQFDKLRVAGGAAVTLLCEAQAYPVPAFRLVPWEVGSVGGEGKFLGNSSCSREIFKF